MIPQELIDTPAWCVWGYEQTATGTWTKVPLCPIKLIKIDVTQEQNWHDYNVAASAAVSWPDKCSLAFIFHPYHPYSGGDMDDPWKGLDRDNPAHQIIAREIEQTHAAVYSLLNSYTELSPSEKGWHTIVKGKLPPAYRNRIKGFEFYSQDRFFTMTGKCINPGVAIRNITSDVEKLGAILGTRTATQDVRNVYNLEPRYSDQELLDKAATDSSGDRFIAAWNGDHVSLGLASASELDLALANYLSPLTDNWEQVKRIYMESPHYNNPDRSKLRDRPKLLDEVIDKSFDQHWPPGQAEALKAAVAAKIAAPAPEAAPATVEAAAEPTPAAPVAYVAPSFSLRPPGLMGDIADFIYSNAARPIHEIALAGALGLMAGICGRSWNYHGLGLNHYVCILVDSGAGKDAMRSGMTRLMAAVAEDHKSAMQYLGPQHIASGPALYKHLQTPGNESFVSYIPEIGHRLSALTDERANERQLEYMRAILDLYSQSGPGQIVQKAVYADSDNNTVAVKQPAFSFVGDSTPEVFWEAVTDAAVTNGLIPRLTLIPYSGPRPPTNPWANVVPVPDQLKKLLGVLVAEAQSRSAKGLSETVAVDDDALAMFREFDTFCDAQWDRSTMQAQKAMWARAYQKCLKLAALVAVGINPYAPRINIACVQWAKAFVSHDLGLILRRFATGEQATSAPTTDRERFVLSKIKRYLNDASVISKYGVNHALHSASFIEYRYLQRVTANVSRFKEGRPPNPTRALHETLKHLIDTGVLAELPLNVVAQMTGGKKVKAYQITDIEAIKTAVDGEEKPG